MAKNQRRIDARHIQLNVSAVNGSGAGNLVKSGDPGVVGKIPFVAETDEDGDGNATCDTGGGYDLAVNAWDPGAAAGLAVVQGDELYWDNTAGLLRPIPADGVMEAGGVYFGFALEPVAEAGDADDVVTVEVKVGR